MTIKHRLNKFGIYRALVRAFLKRKILKDPVWEMNRCYKLLYGRKPDLVNPKEFVEKTYWLQLHTDTSMWTKCADKYRVREYVRDCGLEDYLPHLYGKWDNVKDIEFSTLPPSFVLKSNNSCGTVIVVKDKEKQNEKQIKKTLNSWLKETFGYRGAQLHYLKINPCIIAEELLLADDEQKRISPISLIDYKVYCFRGKPECIWVAYNRTHDGVWMNLFDTEWNEMSNNVVDNFEEYYHYHPEVELKRPACLAKMLEMASILSKPFAEVRVDFYIINNTPIIGELTFTSGTGFFTEDYYKYLGSKIDLSIEKVIR